MFHSCWVLCRTKREDLRSDKYFGWNYPAMLFYLFYPDTNMGLKSTLSATQKHILCADNNSKERTNIGQIG